MVSKSGASCQEGQEIEEDIMSKLIIELELCDGAQEVVMRPDLVKKGYNHPARSLARSWIGHYLDGGGEQDWLSLFEMLGLGHAPGAAYTGELRLIEVMPDGKRLVRWDWKAAPQTPPTDEAALLRSVQADLDALTEEQRQIIFSSYAKCHNK